MDKHCERGNPDVYYHNYKSQIWYCRWQNYFVLILLSPTADLLQMHNNVQRDQ